MISPKIFQQVLKD